jgi:hypothetical protein
LIILGVTHPIPTEYAERIYNDKKTVFIGKKYLGKVSQGDKFILYESHCATSYTGWADIKFIGKVETDKIWRKYGKKLMINQGEFGEYTKNKTEMNIIELENFEKFNKPVKPDSFVTVGGKYIYEKELTMIKKNKD